MEFWNYIYGIAVISLLSGAFFSYKSERKQAGMTWIVLLLILMNCYHTFWAAILNVIHIPVNIISMGIIDLLTGGLLWFFIVKKNCSICKGKIWWNGSKYQFPDH